MSQHLTWTSPAALPIPRILCHQLRPRDLIRNTRQRRTPGRLKLMLVADLRQVRDEKTGPPQAHHEERSNRPLGAE